ncbi:hypothetical protein [Actinacidiphila rubida]|uniref:Lipoprotein n=1 Tax=Actinacidiphila rubida TaxID=310780 RepID=A0A1H8V293_9ACTN|nr:hypothetical protein [Actinacidiphila rubida]SEP09516.1 hypothetical protein SAMN05216267_11003 [Actinacidiphila rubida]
MRTRIAAATLAAAALLTVTACSSGKSDGKADRPAATGSTAGGPAPAAGTQDPAAADRAALTKSVQDYTALFFAGDPDGYDLVSARCKLDMTKYGWAVLAKKGHHDHGSQKATDITIDELSGNLARVSYGAGNIPAMTRKAQPWAREGGTWRWDACQATG